MKMAVLARSLNYVSKVIGYFDNNDIPYVTTSSSNLFREEITIEAGMILRACIDPVGKCTSNWFPSQEWVHGCHKKKTLKF